MERKRILGLAIALVVLAVCAVSVWYFTRQPVQPEGDAVLTKAEFHDEMGAEHG